MGINLFLIHVAPKLGESSELAGWGRLPHPLLPEHFLSAAAWSLERPGPCLLPWEIASHLLCCFLCTLLLSEPQPPSLNNGGMQAMTGQRERPFHTDLPQPLQEPEVMDKQQRIPRTRCVSQGRASACVFQTITGLLTPSARYFDAPHLQLEPAPLGDMLALVPSAHTAGVTNGKGFSPPPVAFGITRKRIF